MKSDIAFILNGTEVRATVAGGDLLIDLLRETFGLTGVKEGCGKGECGACTVIVDGRAVNSCLYPAIEVEGRSVLTIEGLAQAGGKLSILQQSFVDEGGIQCGFCSPGMIMAARALLDRNLDPSPEEIIEALSGNLCRCTGYVQILQSITRAATALRRERKEVAR